MDEKWKLLIFCAAIFIIGGLNALYNIAYASIWVAGFIIQICVQFFPLKVGYYVILPILLAIVAFIVSFYQKRQHT